MPSLREIEATLHQQKPNKAAGLRTIWEMHPETKPEKVTTTIYNPYPWRVINLYISEQTVPSNHFAAFMAEAAFD